MAEADYYKILDVPPDASIDAIKKAYRTLALKHHPDRNPDDAGAADKFKEASEAYAVLSDPSKRSAYDRYGHAGVGADGGGFRFDNMEDIFSQFSDIFGGNSGGFFENLFGFGGGGAGGQRRGQSLRARVAVDLIEILQGTERTLSLQRGEECEGCSGSGAEKGTAPRSCPTCQGRGQVHQQQGFFAVRTACPACHGQGNVVDKPCGDCQGQGVQRKKREIRVSIPAGIEDGAQIRLSGEGEAGLQGGPAGDLFVEIRIRENEHIHREGQDLYMEVPISYPQAVLGDKITVQTLEGEARLSIPSGTAAGKTFRLRGQGLPRLHGGGRGNLFVRVWIRVPEKLKRDEKKWIQKLRDLEK